MSGVRNRDEVATTDSTERLLEAILSAFAKLSRELHNGQSILSAVATKELAETRRVAKLARLHLRQQRVGHRAPTDRPRSRSEYEEDCRSRNT